LPIHIPEDLMVSVSGIRGRVGAPFTPELAAGIAARFGAFMTEGSRGPVCLGRDSRTSGPMFARAVTAGLESVGVDVIDLGVVPTPTLLMAVRDRGAAAGIGVTASHNPAEWNALKLVTEEGISRRRFASTWPRRTRRARAGTLSARSPSTAAPGRGTSSASSRSRTSTPTPFALAA
jgi:hypothetical protein